MLGSGKTQEPAGEWVGKEHAKMQYLVTGEFIDPGSMLPPYQVAGMGRRMILPSHDDVQVHVPSCPSLV
jgi:hypothetical protein